MGQISGEGISNAVGVNDRCRASCKRRRSGVSVLPGSSNIPLVKLYQATGRSKLGVADCRRVLVPSFIAFMLLTRKPGARVNQRRLCRQRPDRDVSAKRLIPGASDKNGPRLTQDSGASEHTNCSSSSLWQTHAGRSDSTWAASEFATIDNVNQDSLGCESRFT